MKYRPPPRSSCPATKPTAGEPRARSRGQEGHCSRVNAKSVGVRPAAACIGSKQGSLSLPHCAPAGGSPAAMAYFRRVRVLGVPHYAARAPSAPPWPSGSTATARRGAAAVGEIGGAMTFDWRRAAGRPWTVAACWCQVVWQEGRRRSGPLAPVKSESATRTPLKNRS